MRKLMVLAASAGLLFTSPALAEPANLGTQCVQTPQNAEAFKLANQIVETMIPADQGETIMRQMMTAVMAQMDGSWSADISDPGMQAILDRRKKQLPDLFMPLIKKHLPSLKAAIACAYTHEFSVEELREVGAFAASPSGKHYLSRSAAILSDPAVAESNRAYFAEAKVLLDEFAEDIAADVTAYRAKKDKKSN